MNAHIPVNHPWVWVDLDGTLMEDNQYPGFGQPRVGAKRAINRLHELGVRVMVFTARTGIIGLDGQYQNVNAVVDQIREWAAKHDIKIDYVFPLQKPTHVLCGFDDRVIPVVCPPDPSRDHWQFWDDAMQVFEKRFGHKLQNWQREVTPSTFEVPNGA